MKAHLHEFEGRMLTMTEIMVLVPRIGRQEIRKHLAAGRRTRQAMLSTDPRAQRRATRIENMQFGKGVRDDRRIARKA